MWNITNVVFEAVSDPAVLLPRNTRGLPEEHFIRRIIYLYLPYFLIRREDQGPDRRAPFPTATQLQPDWRR